MKKKAFNKKLKLQKENIVNLNQLNMIKGGLKVTNNTCVGDPGTVPNSDSAEPYSVLEGDLV